MIKQGLEIVARLLDSNRADTALRDLSSIRGRCSTIAWGGHLDAINLVAERV